MLFNETILTSFSTEILLWNCRKRVLAEIYFLITMLFFRRNIQDFYKNSSFTIFTLICFFFAMYMNFNSIFNLHVINVSDTRIIVIYCFEIRTPRFIAKTCRFRAFTSLTTIERRYKTLFITFSSTFYS